MHGSEHLQTGSEEVAGAKSPIMQDLTLGTGKWYSVWFLLSTGLEVPILGMEAPCIQPWWSVVSRQESEDLWVSVTGLWLPTPCTR